MSMETNRYIRAIEESIADCNYRIDEWKQPANAPHPDRKLKALRDRVLALEELLEFTKSVRKFHNTALNRN